MKSVNPPIIPSMESSENFETILELNKTNGASVQTVKFVNRFKDAGALMLLLLGTAFTSPKDVQTGSFEQINKNFRLANVQMDFEDS